MYIKNVILINSILKIVYIQIKKWAIVCFAEKQSSSEQHLGKFIQYMRLVGITTRMQIREKPVFINYSCQPVEKCFKLDSVWILYLLSKVLYLLEKPYCKIIKLLRSFNKLEYQKPQLFKTTIHKAEYKTTITDS